MQKIFFVILGWLFLHSFAFAQPQATDTSLSVRQLIVRADSFRSVGMVQETLHSYFVALRQAETTNDSQGILLVASRLGQLYERYYRNNEAIPYYQRAYTITRKTDSVFRTAQISNSLAWNFIKVGLVDSALRYSEEAVKLHRSLQPRSAINYAMALESLGEIYSLKQRYADADQALQESMNVGVSGNNEIIQGFTHYGLAFNAFNRGQFASAKKDILLCVPAAEKYASKELLAQVYLLAYNIHDALGLKADALRFLKAFTRLNDQLHSEDLEKKAAIVNANFEIQKKEADVRLLSQQNAIQRLEINRRALLLEITIGATLALIIIAVLFYNRIQNKRKFERQELQRKKDELEQARKVQLSLLPKKPFITDAFEITGKMITATEVGGDYFDFHRLDDHRVLIAFGDATGHGMTAGMMVTITKVALLNNLNLLKDSNDVVPVARAINESILASVSVKGIGMALQLCVVDSKSGTLSITSCGMPYPVLTNPSTGALETEIIQQPPLGFLKSLPLALKERSFTKGDMLVLTSDGILERFNRAKEEYGLARLTHLLKESASKSASLQDLLDRIFSDADAFSQGVSHHDDMTALCARLR